MIHPELLSRLCLRAIYCEIGRTSPFSSARWLELPDSRLFISFGCSRPSWRNPAPVSLSAADQESQASADSDRFIDHRRLHGRRFLEPGQLQRAFFAPCWYVAVGIPTAVPADITTGTAAAHELDPRLPFAHGWNFGERAIFEKTARGRG